MLVLHREPCNAGKKPSERTMEESLHYGLIVIDKPRGPTSHEASAFVRKMLCLSKAGHTGTLDANVSGVLPVLLEEACKASRYISEKTKTYVCIMRCGEQPTAATVEETFSHFRGKIWQKPPLASAVAKKLRVREIHSLKTLEVQGKDVLFEAHVDAGTYIRNLCFDAGEVMGIKTEMLELRRTEAAGFTENQAITLQKLSDLWWLYKEHRKTDLQKHLVQVEDALKLKKVVVSDDALRPICTGADLAIPGILSLDENIKEGDSVALMTGKGELACIAKALLSTKTITSQEKGIAFDVERVVQAF